MNRITFEVPMSPSPESVNHFIGLHPSSQTFDKKYCKIYLFNEEYKKGSLVLTKLQLPLLNLNEPDKEVFIFKANYHLLEETLIKYIPVSDKEYLLLFYLSSDSDFKEFSDRKNMSHKKGKWIITCLNNGTISYNLLFPKGTNMTAICAYIPTESLKSFTSASIDSYLKRLLHTEESYLIYEAVSSRLKQLFESVNANKMESFLEMMMFQEDIYAILKTIFEQLSHNNASAIKYNFKKNDLDALAKAEQLLLRNIQEPPTIQELANEAAMSPTKFKSAFKKVYGESVYQYYLNHRMQLAHQWLLENKLNITEIAKELGYKNLAHFSRKFKEHFGELPSKYK